MDNTESNTESNTENNTELKFRIISRFIRPNSHILDVGCGDGSLLSYLKHHRHVSARGIELDVQWVKCCMNAGHCVLHGDANTDLYQYPTKSFDTVVLSHTLQAMSRADKTLLDITRIGKKAVVSFPNFGHYQVIWDLFYNRRMPTTKRLPLAWYKTPNIHFCTIRDFVNLCDSLGLYIDNVVIITNKGKEISARPTSYKASLWGASAVFVVSDRQGNTPRASL